MVMNWFRNLVLSAIGSIISLSDAGGRAIELLEAIHNKTSVSKAGPPRRRAGWREG